MTPYEFHMALLVNSQDRGGWRQKRGCICHNRDRQSAFWKLGTSGEHSSSVAFPSLAAVFIPHTSSLASSPWAPCSVMSNSLQPLSHSKPSLRYSACIWPLCGQVTNQNSLCWASIFTLQTYCGVMWSLCEGSFIWMCFMENPVILSSGRVTRQHQDMQACGVPDSSQLHYLF